MLSFLVPFLIIKEGNPIPWSIYSSLNVHLLLLKQVYSLFAPPLHLCPIILRDTLLLNNKKEKKQDSNIQGGSSCEGGIQKKEFLKQ